MAHGVDPAVDGVQPAGTEPPLDRTLSDAQCLQLPPGNHAMLSSGEDRDRLVGVHMCVSTIHAMVGMAKCGHGLDDGGGRRARGARDVTNLPSLRAVDPPATQPNQTASQSP